MKEIDKPGPMSALANLLKLVDRDYDAILAEGKTHEGRQQLDQLLELVEELHDTVRDVATVREGPNDGDSSRIGSRIVLERSKDLPGVWVAHDLDFDVVSQGDSIESAVAMLRFAIRLARFQPSDRR
jgi:hypothetical protein